MNNLRFYFDIKYIGYIITKSHLIGSVLPEIFIKQNLFFRTTTRENMMNKQFFSKNTVGIFLLIISLFCVQIFLGYFLIRGAYFIAQNYTNRFDLYSYCITLISISYTVYCYILLYKILQKFFSNIRGVRIGMFGFYILSLVSYTLVSGSYSPFFLIGIKMAQINK